MNTIGQRVVGSGTGAHGVILSIGEFVTEVLEDGATVAREYGSLPGNLLAEDGPLIRCGCCDWLHDSADAVRECYGEAAHAELEYRLGL